MAENKTAKTKPATKTQVQQLLAEKTGLSRKQVAAFFDELGSLIKQQLTKGPGVFTIPGMIKIKKVKKPATKARQGINPFTKQPTTFAAKPASKSVRARPIKAIKDAMQ